MFSIFSTGVFTLFFILGWSGLGFFCSAGFVFLRPLKMSNKYPFLLHDKIFNKICSVFLEKVVKNYVLSVVPPSS